MYTNFKLQAFTLLLSVTCAGIVASPQSSKSGTDAFPKEIRGYKIERAEVEVKKPKKGEPTSEEDEILIRLGDARLVKATPLGVTFEVPLILSPITQQGNVDLLVFEDMRVNGTPVTIEDYMKPFSLPNKSPLTLNPPLTVFVSTPMAVLTTIDEIWNSKERWPVTGRIYVCGHFKKFLFKFKRAVPVQIQSSINNPLR